ncbi:MAG: hypothetical protein HFJ17_02095 [Clostridia bacterium]|nr:hypothetical protein [Clostridia bacterium]
MTTMSFLEAARIGIIQRLDPIDPTKLFCDYKRAITLISEKTGFYINQTFIRENNLTWYYDMDDLRIPNLYSSTTKFRIYLAGITGLSNIQSTLNDMVQVYNNDKLGYTVRLMSYNDFKRDGGLLSILGDDWAWTDNLYVSDDNNSVRDYGVHLVGDKTTDYYTYLHSSNGHQYCTSAGVHVAMAILSSDILVDLESKQKEGVWKLLPP